jgi:hypothetical protein
MGSAASYSTSAATDVASWALAHQLAPAVVFLAELLDLAALGLQCNFYWPLHCLRLVQAGAVVATKDARDRLHGQPLDRRYSAVATQPYRLAMRNRASATANSASALKKPADNADGPCLKKGGVPVQGS